MHIEHLLAQAADPYQTAPERAAALSAAARTAAPDHTWPSPLPGWAWCDGRVVCVTSTIPPLKVRAHQAFGEEEEPIAEEPEPMAEEPAEAVQLVGSEASERSPKLGSSAARIIEMLQRPGGVSVEEVMAELGCAQVSVRALISINSRRIGAKVILADGRYRMAGGEPSQGGSSTEAESRPPVIVAPTAGGRADQPVGSEAQRVRLPKPGSKAARLLDLLRRPEGVSVTEAVEELGCKPISIKGMVSIYSRRIGATAVLDNGRYKLVEARYRRAGSDCVLVGIEAA
ncbi:MAG: hypothetical protein ACK4F5_14935 [Aliihoeflea sp.]